MAARRDSQRRAIFFVSDGMRADLVQRYVEAGAMPVVAALMARGATGRDGCLPALPANTGAGWATLATGAWSGTNGAINNVFHSTDTPITTVTSGFDARLIVAETLAQAAERQGLTTACVEWAGTIPATSQGPVIDFRTFYSERGVLRTFEPEGYRPDEASRLGVADQAVTFAPALSWRNPPPSALPLLQASLVVRTTRPQENPDRVFELCAYARSAAGYDRLLIAHTRDGSAPVCDLAAGDWAEVRVALTDGARAGFHFKLIDLSPDLQLVRLYFTATSRARAHPPELEDLLASDAFAVSETADHGPMEAGLIDAESYVEQGLMFYQRAIAVYRYVLEQFQPDVLFAGTPVTDEFSHMFMGRVTPASPDYRPAGAGRYESYLRAAYTGADELLGVLLENMPADTLVAVSSDHGFGAVWRSLNANLTLARAGLLDPDADGRPLASSRAAAFWAGGTCNIYVNLAGREPGGVVAPADYDRTCKEIIAAMAALEREGDAGPVLDRVLRFADCAAIPVGGGTASMQYSGRTGDVVVFALPPYQFDAPHSDRLVAPSPLTGQHGFLPDTVDRRCNVDMRAPLVLAGPGVRAGILLDGARAIDIAPTLSRLLGIDPPGNADGRCLTEALDETQDVALEV